MADGYNNPMFDRLLGISRGAFEARRFSSAYHALAAALHWAEEDNDEEQLRLVEQEVTEQLAWIDRNAPAYHHSTQSARERGNESIFVTLSRQARTRANMVHRGSDGGQHEGAS